MKDYFVIGITGGSGSGKTTIVEDITKSNPSDDICTISQDSYYNDVSNLTFEERCLINFDHPDSIDFNLLNEHLSELKAGRVIEQPIYCFKTHNRTSKKLITKPRKIIIIEGILIFNSKTLRELCDLKIYIDAHDDERLIRRIKRDINYRGRELDEILNWYQETLKPMHKQYIETTKKFADVIIPNNNYNLKAIDFINSVIKDHL